MTWPTKLVRLCLALSVILIPLIFLPFTSELFEFNKMVATYILCSVIAFGWICDWLLSGHFRFQKTSLDWPILLFLASQLLSLLFSIDLRTSWLGYYSRFNGGLASLFCYSLLYWAFVTFADAKFTHKFLLSALITSVLVALYGILEHFGIDAKWWVQDVQTRVFSTLGQPNWLAAYLCALIFIPLSYIKNKYFSFSLFAILFITLLFTKSRSGLLAFGISSAVFWLLQFPPKLRGNVKGVFIFIALTLTLTLAIPNPVRDLVLRSPQARPPEALAKEGPALETGGTESGTIRKIVWTGALRIWQANTKNLLIGTGPETFAMSYYAHRPLEHNNTSEWELLYNKAHNEFLNFLATTGLLGLGLYLFLLFSMFLIFYHSLKIPNLKFQITGLLAGWLTLSVTNFWGFSVVINQILLFLLPAAAFSLSQNPQTITHNSKPITHNSLAIFLALSVLGVLCFYILRYWVADIKYASGQKYLRAFTQTQETTYILNSYNDYATAFSLNKSDAPLSSDYAVITAYMALVYASTDATASANLTSAAQVLSDHTIALSPAHPNYWKSRSRTFLILSSLDPKYYAPADAALATAQQLSPTDPRILYSRGMIAFYQNHICDAISYLQAALKLKPDFADALGKMSEIASSSAKISSCPK